MGETLVIVHLSSLDSLHYFEGVSAVESLSQRLIDAIQRHDHILIMDQGTPEREMSPESYTWRNSVLTCRHDIIYFHHDEMMDTSPWQDGMKALAHELRKFKAKVVLGGLWASQSGKSGCVHEVKRQMRARNITCIINKDLCAYED